MEITLVNTLLLMIIALAILVGVLSLIGSRIKNRLDATSMYNVAACLVVASIISGAMSLIAVWVAFPNNKEVDFTHQDVLVDILGVLVTLLMGWNILSVVDIKKKADEVDCIANDFEHVVTGIMQLNMRGSVMRGKTDALIDSCFISLEEILNCDNKNFCRSAITEIINLLHKINQNAIEKGQKVYIYPQKRQKYLFLINHEYIQSEYKVEVQSMIKSADESQTIGKETQFSSDIDILGTKDN